MNILQLFRQKWKGTMEFKQQYGWKKTIIVVKRTLLHQPVNDLFLASPPQPVPVSHTMNAQDLLDIRFRFVQPIQAIHIKEKVQRLNFVIDTLDKDSILNGNMVGVILATEFARKNNMTLRIITRKSAGNPNVYKKILEINHLEAFNHVEFYSDHERNVAGETSYKLDVSETDVFMVNSWWCAEAVKKTSFRKRFFYIVQDVEEMSYPHNEEGYLCSQILSDTNIDFIFASSYLKDFYTRYISDVFDKTVALRPAYVTDNHSTESDSQKDKYKLLFLAMPDNPQNMFYHTIKMLDQCIQMGVIDTDEWEMYCVGINVPKIVFGEDYEVHYVDYTDWEQYIQFLSQVDLAISLKNSPIIGYLPNEVVSYGGVALTNYVQCEKELSLCKNIILTDLREDTFENKLYEAIQLAKDKEKRAANYKQSTMAKDWKDTIGEILEYMQEKL